MSLLPPSLFVPPLELPLPELPPESAPPEPPLLDDAPEPPSLLAPELPPEPLPPSLPPGDVSWEGDPLVEPQPGCIHTASRTTARACGWRRNRKTFMGGPRRKGHAIRRRAALPTARYLRQRSATGQGQAQPFCTQATRCRADEQSEQPIAHRV